MLFMGIVVKIFFRNRLWFFILKNLKKFLMKDLIVVSCGVCVIYF